MLTQPTGMGCRNPRGPTSIQFRRKCDYQNVAFLLLIWTRSSNAYYTSTTVQFAQRICAELPGDYCREYTKGKREYCPGAGQASQICQCEAKRPRLHYGG